MGEEMKLAPTPLALAEAHATLLGLPPRFRTVFLATLCLFFVLR